MFWEVTPEDRAKLRNVNMDRAEAAAPVYDIGQAIDDPFDDVRAA